MTEEYWANTQFSVARYYGRIKISGETYIIVDKRGHDVFECSFEAAKAGRTHAIEPGEPADLLMEQYVPVYRKLGRDKFIAWLNDGSINHDIQAAYAFAGIKCPRKYTKKRN